MLVITENNRGTLAIFHKIQKRKNEILYWTTEEHEDWDRQGEVKILEKHEIKGGQNE